MARTSIRRGNNLDSLDNWLTEHFVEYTYIQTMHKPIIFHIVIQIDLDDMRNK